MCKTWHKDIVVSIHKGPFHKKLENVVWEVLSKAQYINEKLVWGESNGNERENK